MAQYKGTVIFSEGRHGWTESYYLIGSTPSAAATNLIAICTARAAILQADLILVSASISDVTVRGDSTPVITIPESGAFEDATGYMDLDVAVLIKWQVGVFNRNKTFIRGIPLSVTQDGTYTPTGPYTTAMNAYLTAVQTNAKMPLTTRNVAPPPAYINAGYAPILDGSTNLFLARRKSGRPIGLPRGRRVAP